MFALLSARLRTLIIGAVLVRLAPLLARMLRSAGDGLRRRRGDTMVSGALTKAGDGLAWFARRRTKPSKKHGIEPPAS